MLRDKMQARLRGCGLALVVAALLLLSGGQRWRVGRHRGRA